MKNRVIKIPLSVAGLKAAIEAVEEYEDWLETKKKEFLERLAYEGLNLATVKFQKAVYDGDNDVSVYVENRGPKKMAVVAVGQSVLFIEFGTGVVYPDNHPEAPILGMRRGKYGRGKGSQESWGYYGQPGTHGEVLKETEKGALIITSGNPANMPMYTTVKELEEKIRKIAEEVFR